MLKTFNEINLRELVEYWVDLNNPLDFISAILDISIVSYIIYKIILLIRETRALQLIKGIVFVMIAARVSDYLGLKTVAFLLNNTIQYFVLIFVILFQPELRRGLESIGRSKFGVLFSFEQGVGKFDIAANIDSLVKACGQMSKSKTGALIVIERETKIGETISSGVFLESKVSTELIVNIFTPNTPLHDGAIVIRAGKIEAAGCFLPLTENIYLSNDLGTRHRAALGITEVSDAIAIVVSEETGNISYARNGILTRNISSEILRTKLIKSLVENGDSSGTKKRSLWKVKKSERD